MLTVDWGGAEDIPNFDLVIISSRNQFYQKMKFIEAQGIPRNRILDGYVFKIPNLDFPRLLKEGVSYGIFDSRKSFFDNTNLIYPRVYKFKNDSVTTINLGAKSRINSNGLSARMEGRGIITFGNFSSIAWGGFFQLDLNVGHNPRLLTSYHPDNFDWAFPRDFRAPSGVCKINIGSDVWIGRGCILKCTNPKKTLVIGDGAVIA
ncbi:MAG: hypothetical protein IJP42_10660, partial [Selenomonadaceae bacterium]|nr:hypothetical protein [Selenomonadaceae bacterium]